MIMILFIKCQTPFQSELEARRIRKPLLKIQNHNEKLNTYALKTKSPSPLSQPAHLPPQPSQGAYHFIIVQCTSHINYKIISNLNITKIEHQITKQHDNWQLLPVEPEPPQGQERHKLFWGIAPTAAFRKHIYKTT